MSMCEEVKGKKTYTGIIVTLVGVLGLSDFITAEETANTINQVLELVGIALAVYGRSVVKTR